MSGHSGNLAVFYRPMTDEGECQTEWIDYRPTGQLTSDGALEFNVPGNSTKYIDLKNTRLKIKCKILQANVSNLPSPDLLPVKVNWYQRPLKWDLSICFYKAYGGR